MPIYEYQCEKCGEVFEATQKMSDPPLTKHAECGSKKVKRLISQTSFQLKGGGWYVTDYKKSSAPSETTKTEPAADKPAASKEADAPQKKSAPKKKKKKTA